MNKGYRVVVQVIRVMDSFGVMARVILRLGLGFMQNRFVWLKNHKDQCDNCWASKLVKLKLSRFDEHRAYLIHDINPSHIYRIGHFKKEITHFSSFLHSCNDIQTSCTLPMLLNT